MTHGFTSTAPSTAVSGGISSVGRFLFDFLGALRLSHRASTDVPQAAVAKSGLFKWFGRSSPRPSTSKTLHMEIHKQAFSAYRQEIGQWQQARSLRYQTECPLTHALQEVYKDTMLDAHLSAAVGNRILRLQNKRYVVRGADGQLHEEKTGWLERCWFQELIEHIASSIFYGYSLVWLKSIDVCNKQVCIELVDRRHVVPERGLVLTHMQDRDGGLSYADYPHDLLYAQLSDGFGLLEKAAPLAILKRHSWANWDEFEQIFGLPIRIARVPNLETRDTHRIAQWLEEMGTAAYAVFPDSVQVEVKESRRSDAHEVFKEKILAVNAEMSKLVNGQTMTVDSGSSYSQSAVHLRTESEITRADIRNLLRWLSDVLLPALRMHGYGFEEGDKVDIWEEAPAAEKITIDKELLRAGVRLSPAYLSRTYGVVLEEAITSEDPS